MDNVTPIRTAKGQFVKGQSGNPLGGNSRTIARAGMKKTLDDLMRENAPKVMLRLVEMIFDPNTPPAPRVAAIKEYFDRHLGKPKAVAVIRRDDINLAASLDMSEVPEDVLRRIADLNIQKG